MLDSLHVWTLIFAGQLLNFSRYLRDHGDAQQWTNLNGLWEWEPSTAAGVSSPPFGRTLNSSILGIVIFVNSRVQPDKLVYTPMH